MMNAAMMVTMLMMNSVAAQHSSVRVVRTSKAATTTHEEPKTHVLYEVCKGKAGKTVLAVYKARKAAEAAAIRMNGHVHARFVTFAEYKATESSAKK